MDIVWATLIAGAIVITLGLILRAKATSGVPGKFQLVWELVVGAVQNQVDDSIGPRGAKVVPLALTLFIFIFTCNLFEVLGIGSQLDFLPAPTSDINLPLAMALYVIVLVHRAAIKNRGVGGYFKHYVTQPFPAKLFPGQPVHERHRRAGQAGHPDPPSLRQPVRRRPDAVAAGRPGDLEVRPRRPSAASCPPRSPWSGSSSTWPSVPSRPSSSPS